MAGLIDGERITGEPCSIWLFMAAFAIAVSSYIGSMALSDMAEKTGVAAGCLFDPNDPYWNSDDEDL